MSSRGEFSRKTSWNLIAELPGSEQPDSKVLVCSHYDSQSKGSHAWDNVSGDVALLALARATVDLTPKRTIQLIFFGVEEQGVFSGSRAFARQRRAEMDSYAIVINLDGLSAVLCPLNVIQATPGALAYAYAAAEKQGWPVHKRAPLSRNSDHAPFMDAGVPAIWAHEWPRSPYQHTEGDVFEHLDMEKLLHTAGVGARCALDLAYLPDLELRSTAETDAGAN